MTQQGATETISTGKKILLFIVGLILSEFGPFVFIAMCLVKGDSRAAFFTGAGVGELIIAVCLFIVGGVASTKLCDPATLAANGVDMSDPATADQYVSICVAAVNALRYSYFGVGAVYIIMAIASFVVSWKARRSAKAFSQA
ncbi:hypothetical protein BJ742DRAFT_807463 [Cladochytrium replicatum]|nr:hypothetical protein BJ742DRAFT_807463 [Cladochytrium replicatum]